MATAISLYGHVYLLKYSNKILSYHIFKHHDENFFFTFGVILAEAMSRRLFTVVLAIHLMTVALTGPTSGQRISGVAERTKGT